MRILLVDDHTLVRRGLAHLVTTCVENAEVTEAGSADEAIEQLAVQPHDVALVDIRMPGAAPRDPIVLAEPSGDHALELRQRGICQGRAR